VAQQGFEFAGVIPPGIVVIARSAPSSPAPSARRDAALGLDRSARPSKPGDRAANGSYGAARLSDGAGFLTYLRALPTGTRSLHAAGAALRLSFQRCSHLVAFHRSIQPDSGPPALPNCAKDSYRSLRPWSPGHGAATHWGKPRALAASARWQRGCSIASVT